MWFRFYQRHLITGVVLILAIAVLALWFPEDRQVIVAGTAAILGFFYFVHSQQLQRSKFFKELFIEFNGRYDKLNGALSEIGPSTTIDKLPMRELVDYFNLCSEEYLFYREGYIPDDVWCSWCRGMLQYLNVPTVENVWNHEMKTGSYYGLTRSVVDAGACHRH
jgi:hypothetical protein